MKRIVALLMISIVGVMAAEMSLWYDKPAQDWEREALPIGNGRLAAMLFGEPSAEHIQFNEESLWIGDEKDTGAYQAFGDVIVDFKSSGDGSPPRLQVAEKEVGNPPKASVTASRAAPLARLRPNLVSSWPVRIRRWVCGSMPGVTRRRMD